jgi:3-phenylpropionate/trans-cinnamate dioxygenase ferredoxin component
MTRFFVGRTSDIPEGKMIHIQIDKKKKNKDILIANVHGRYYATSNICTHEGAKLHGGELKDNELICPWHGAKWDVTSGKMILFPEKLKSLTSFKVIVENDNLYLEDQVTRRYCIMKKIICFLRRLVRNPTRSS